MLYSILRPRLLSPYRHTKKAKLGSLLSLVGVCDRKFVHGAAAASGDRDTYKTTENASGPVTQHPHNSTFGGLGRYLRSFDSSLLEPAETPVSSSPNSELISSYTWLPTTSPPTIHVPGVTPTWKPMIFPAQLASDDQFIDPPNRSRSDYRFEAAFQATNLMKPGFRFDNVDIVARHRTLLDLFKFSCDRGHSKRLTNLNLYLIKNTLIIAERKSLDDEGAKGSFKFGRDFRRANTQLPIGAEEEFNYRMIQYSLGGLSCAVLSRVDACCRSSDDDMSLEPDFTTVASHGTPLDNHGMSKAPSPPLKSPLVKVIARGSIDPQSSTVEITTTTRQRSKSSNIRQLLKEQLWFSRTPYLFQGIHGGQGFFRKPRTAHLTQNDFRAWEATEDNQAGLRKMVHLLSQLRDTVKATEEKSCVVLVSSRNLRVFVNGGRPGMGIPKILSDNTVAEFWSS
ncbi:hypothetical protein B0T17DRAFT_81944 [Bombardia bombarda]|uniref:Uncharacterized protein n=1 Tax=Bombardia bombarda TaxID=252184 RepID=A0AA40CGG7_9PEZI|nr:hypothetical protein B0T17DRAFT_81944 [Bombardia bombarda]